MHRLYALGWRCPKGVDASALKVSLAQWRYAHIWWLVVGSCALRTAAQPAIYLHDHGSMNVPAIGTACGVCPG